MREALNNVTNIGHTLLSDVSPKVHLCNSICNSIHLATMGALGVALDSLNWALAGLGVSTSSLYYLTDNL